MKSVLPNVRRFTPVVVSVSELCDGLASTSLAAQDATLVRIAGPLARATIVTRPPVALVTLPQSQRTTPDTFAHDPRVVVTEIKAARLERTFVIATLVAVVLPTLVTVRV